MIELTDRELDLIGFKNKLSFINGCSAHEILSTIKQTTRRLNKNLVLKVCDVAHFYGIYRLKAIRVLDGKVQIFHFVNGEIEKVVFNLKGKGIL